MYYVPEPIDMYESEPISDNVDDEMHKLPGMQISLTHDSQKDDYCYIDKASSESE